MAPPRSLCFKVYDDIIIVALGVSPTRDDDWSRFIEQAGGAMMQRPRPILVMSEGGLPSASQREEMDQRLPPGGVLTAIMTDSLVTRGAVATSFWTNSTVRAFPMNSKFRVSPNHDGDDTLLQALRYLGVAPSRDAAIVREIPSLCDLVASGPRPWQYAGDIFDALDDEGRLWGQFWINRHHDGLSVRAPVKGDGSHDDVTVLLELKVVQTTVTLTLDLTFWQPSKGMRGSTKTGEERWTGPDPSQPRSLDLTFAGRAWGRLVAEAGRWRFLDPKGRTRLELTPTTDTTHPFTLRRSDMPVLRVSVFGPDGQALQKPMTALHP
jgi:hypothetical protein